MADGWELAHGCIFRGPAHLPGFSRSLDKASTQARGSKAHPAPTLRIVPSEGVCRGVAFEFNEARREAVFGALLQREGRTFPLREKQIVLDDGRRTSALVPIYEGKQILLGKTATELAQLAIEAVGELGNGVDYVRDVARHLREAGIVDPAIDAVEKEIDRLLGDRIGGRH